MSNVYQLPTNDQSQPTIPTRPDSHVPESPESDADNFAQVFGMVDDPYYGRTTREAALYSKESNPNHIESSREAYERKLAGASLQVDVQQEEQYFNESNDPTNPTRLDVRRKSPEHIREQGRIEAIHRAAQIENMRANTLHLKEAA
jgi:hypothetical protein